MTDHSPTPDQQQMRRRIAAILEAAPESIYPCLLALSDAVAQHDPRHRRYDDQDAA